WLRGRTGKDALRWKGGRTLKCGYVMVHMSDHPRADLNGYVREHVLIAEAALGKSLPPGAEVHHVNLVTSANGNNNLVICQDSAYHHLLHARLRALRGCGNPALRTCKYCHAWDDPRNLYGEGQNQYHPACKNNRQRDRYAAREG